MTDANIKQLRDRVSLTWKNEDEKVFLLGLIDAQLPAVAPAPVDPAPAPAPAEPSPSGQE